MTTKFKQLLALFLLSIAVTHSHADNVNIAVASNFSHTLQMLADDFKAKTGHQLRVSSASTGKLYTQINHGAPFDIFMSADENSPDRLITEGKARPELGRVYAVGRLTLLSNIKTEKDCQNILGSTELKRLSIANPKTAPYGAAAQQTLEKLQRWESVNTKLVMGENIAQTLQFVSTGSASAGFVAKAMLLQGAKIEAACEWDVPADMHEPIKQKMVVLDASADKPAVKAFWQYMQSDAATAIITNSGYDVL